MFLMFYSTLNKYILQNEILINNDILGQIMRSNIIETQHKKNSQGIATRCILLENIFYIKNKSCKY